MPNIPIALSAPEPRLPHTFSWEFEKAPSEGWMPNLPPRDLREPIPSWKPCLQPPSVIDDRNIFVRIIMAPIDMLNACMRGRQ